MWLIEEAFDKAKAVAQQEVHWIRGGFGEVRLPLSALPEISEPPLSVGYEERYHNVEKPYENWHHSTELETSSGLYGDPRNA